MQPSILLKYQEHQSVVLTYNETFNVKRTEKWGKERQKYTENKGK